MDSESISSQKEGASEESLSATPKKKNKKLIWALIVALFLLVTVVEGAICVHLFMPKVKEKEEDKLLVEMLDKYTLAVKESADEHIFDLVHFENEKAYDVEMRDYLYMVINGSNYGIRDLEYEILGTHGYMEDSFVATVEFRYVYEENAKRVKKDLTVYTDEDSYYMKEWISLRDEDFTQYKIDDVLASIGFDVIINNAQGFLNYCNYDAVDAERVEELVRYQVKRMDKLEWEAVEYEPIDRVTGWLEYASTLPLIKVKSKYEIRYADDIGTASTEGYVDLIFVNGDSYYFYEIPTLFTKEE